MVTRVRTAGRSSPATGLDSDVRQLADEHALLLRGVQGRAASVLALTAARTWPYAELDTLTAFLRTAVLPQARDEEDRLYPGRRSAPFAQLSARHAHIRALIELLEHVDATSCTLSELRRLVEGLEHHIVEEQVVLAAQLAALEDAPCMPEPDVGAQQFPPNEPVLTLIEALREDHSVQMRIQRARGASSQP